MNNLDLILGSIKNKAEEEKKQILDKAREEADEIIADAKNKASKEAERIMDKADADSKLILDNERLSASRKARDIKIGAKNDLINQVMEKVIEKLKNLDEKDYKDFVLNRIKDFDGRGADLVLKEGMENAFDEADLNGLNILDETTDDGFIIKSKNLTYDNSFSSIVDYEKDEIKKIISDALFTKDAI